MILVACLALIGLTAVLLTTMREEVHREERRHLPKHPPEPHTRAVTRVVRVKGER